MADGAQIRVVGFDQFIAASERLTGRIADSATREFGLVAERRAEAIRNVMPRESGALAGSVSASQESDRALLGFGGDDVPYAGWIEFGGIREGGRNSWAERPYMPKGRYFYPLAVGHEPLLADAGAKAANDEIGRYPWPRPR
jgi:hypothetical protein